MLLDRWKPMSLYPQVASNLRLSVELEERAQRSNSKRNRPKTQIWVDLCLHVDGLSDERPEFSLRLPFPRKYAESAQYDLRVIYILIPKAPLSVLSNDGAKFGFYRKILLADLTQIVLIAPYYNANLKQRRYLASPHVFKSGRIEKLVAYEIP